MTGPPKSYQLTLKGVENYFTDSILYQYSLEVGSGNEADEELETDDDCPWELNVSLTD